MKFRWAIYRDGSMVGAARSRQDAQARIEAGCYDPEPKDRVVTGY